MARESIKPYVRLQLAGRTHEKPIEDHAKLRRLVAVARWMGYRDVSCMNCAQSMWMKGRPDHGLCRRTKLSDIHFTPIRSWELCPHWQPRYGLLHDSPCMRGRPEPAPDAVDLMLELLMTSGPKRAGDGGDSR